MVSCCILGCPSRTERKTPNITFFTLQMSQENQPVIRRERHTSQWESLLRKFSESHKEECKIMSFDIPRVPRSVKKFPTGSQYEGTWNVLGMSGLGTYTFSHGVLYKGEFEDGMFHGAGELQYPSGIIIKGRWDRGHMTERKLIFADGVEYDEENWKYCEFPDRRFSIEYEKGIQADPILTADQPTRKIPEGFYDTGDGFYDPKTKLIKKAEDINSIERATSDRESKWIEENCRKNPDTPVGPRPDLYEEWLEPSLNPESTPTPASTSYFRTGSTDLFQLKSEDRMKVDDCKHLWFEEEDSSSSSTSSSLFGGLDIF